MDTATFMNNPAFRVPDSRLISVLDATLLREDATESDVRALAHRIKGKGLAALCVRGAWIAAARDALGDDTTPIASVANFPTGENGPWEAGEEAADLHAKGAQEIDIVVPTDCLHRDDGTTIRWTIEAVREAAPGCVVKAILETGALDAPSIRKAAAAAIAGGADFLKTSTGFHQVGATPEAVAAILDVMQAFPGRVGLKVSGGVSDIDTASAYWQQTERAMGAQWCHRKRFRIGASTLLDALL